MSKNGKYGSPSIVSQDNSVIGYVKAGGEYTKNTITFDDEVIFPGSNTKKTIRLENLSRDAKYIRIYAQLQILIDNEFKTNDFVDVNLANYNANWTKSSTDNKLYYTQILEGNNFVDVDLNFEIYNYLDTQDFDENYKNLPYIVNVCVETRNTNTQLDKDNIQVSWEKGL